MHPLARLNHFFWTYKHLFIPGLLCTMISAGFQITVPMVVRQAIDSIPRFVHLYNLFDATPAQGDLYAYFFGALLIFSLVIIALTVISGIFKFLMRQTVVVASRHIEYDLRNTLYNHLQNLSPKFYQDYSTGDVITRATDDIEKVRRYIGPAIMYITRSVVMVVVAVSVMFAISPRLTLYVLIPMPLLAISVFFMAHMVHSRSEALQRQYSDLTSRVQEALSGIRVLKAYTRENAEAEAFEAESDEYKVRNLDLALIDAAWRPVFLLLVGLSTIIVVWVGGQLVVEGVITIGNIAEYIIYVALMTWPVASMGFVITMVQRASASVIRLNKILDTEPTIQDNDRTDPSIERIEGAIAFRNVSFRYEDDEPLVLDDINFDLPAGGTLGIVGRTGSGKSTLVEMIPRLIEPDEGLIEIDGHDLRRIPLQTLRRSIGYVPQDVFLFSDTVANNIAYGRLGGATREEVVAAADAAHASDFIHALPEGFDTEVGENGVMLSGGQRQRLAIARALLKDAPVLILDEATSALDSESEHAVQLGLERLLENRTTLVIAHRLSTIENADRIVVMAEGRIREQGTHAELLAHNGTYAGLYRIQFGENSTAG